MCHIETQCSLINAGNQIKLCLTCSFSYTFYHLALVCHYLLQGVGNHLITAENDLCLHKQIQKAVDKVNSRGVCNSIQCIKDRKEILPRHRLNARKFHLHDIEVSAL